MKLKFYFGGFLLLMYGSATMAQTIKESYVDYGTTGSKVLTAVQTWNSTYKLTDDDNFFVSRIKSKPRFRNTATQVKPSLTDANDKRLLCWFPWEDQEKGVGQNAMPHGNFDTEVFSMWSYVSHWGDWSAALIRVPAPLLDVAHKNGVAVSGTGFIPNSSIASTEWSNWINSLTAELGSQTAKMCYYFGNNGVGYNSEFTSNTSSMANVIAYHKRLTTDLIALGDVNAESMWYEGTGDNGVVSFNNALGGVKGLMGTADEPGLSMMTDYSSMNASTLNGMATNAGAARGSFYGYAGCNLQTGISGGWGTLKDYNVSIGLWGAHKNNMFFQQRYRGGNDPATQQRTYLLSTERWFGGGYRNPVLHTTAFNNLNYSHTNITKNPGMCSMMSARSTLCWDLSAEPFVSFLNIGNGTFLNYKGVRANNNEWGNVGVQDYLPTWRFWFHNNWLGRTTSDIPADLDAQFIWTDAYVGGSCLEIAGSTSGSYLHLFKTQFALQAGDVITVRYKLAAGSGDVDLAMSVLGNEDDVITGSNFNLVAPGQHHDSDVWEERTFVVGDGNTLAGKTLAVIALHFNSLTDAKLYLGEVSIIRGTSPTPSAPVDLRTSIVYKGTTGIDAKLIWEMPGKKAMPQPTYNLDVNTSLFKIYSQVDSNEPTLMALTTSWAGFSFQTPTNGSKVRFGVSAVSTDFSSESVITWGDWNDISALAHNYNDNIQIDKNTIKPDEAFTVSYIDDEHEDATWKILNKDGVEKASGTGKTFTASLTEEGIYTLVVEGYVHEDGITPTAKTVTYTDYIVISPETTGSFPEIYTFTLDGSTEGISINKNEDHTLAFTARNSDGQISKGLNMQSRFFGNLCKTLGIKTNGTAYNTTNKIKTTTATSWSFSYWIKPSLLSGGWFKVCASDQATWPRNNWGNFVGEILEDGTLKLRTHSSGSFGLTGDVWLYWPAQLAVDKWTHLCMVLEYASSQYYATPTATTLSRAAYSLKPKLYVNGQLCQPNKMEWNDPSNGATVDISESLMLTDPTYGYVLPTRTNNLTTDYFWIGGPDRVGGIEGTIDHVMMFDKALTADEVLTTMNDITSAPANIIGYWDFDSNTIDSDHGIVPKYGTSTHKLYLFDAEAGANEGQFVLTKIAPDYTSGYPFLSASHEVKTIPTWDVPGADIKSSSLTTSSKKIKAAGDLTGSATVRWPTDAYRDITLTLTNDYGSDSKTITAVRVGDPVSGIDDIWADQDKLQIIQSQDVVIVRVEEAGQYEFRLFAADGRIIDQKADHMTAGNSVTLNLPNQGVYILSIVKDGKLYNGYKFIRQ